MYPIEADSTCDHSLKNAYGSRERASLQGNLALCLRRHAPQGSGVSPRQTASRAGAGAAGAGVNTSTAHTGGDSRVSREAFYLFNCVSTQ